jgi:hypothetical protein
MKKLITPVILIFVFTLCTLPASADEFFPTEPFEITSADDSKFFRFNPESENDYAEAAVYTNTEPPELIYSLENFSSFAYESNFYFSNDMMQFAFIPTADQQTAIKFYSNGTLNKKYKINELVRNMLKVRYSISAADWMNYDARPIHSGDILTVKTVDDMTYDFDIAAGGKIVKTSGFSIPLSIGIIGIGVLSIAIAGGITWITIMLTKQKRK